MILWHAFRIPINLNIIVTMVISEKFMIFSFIHVEHFNYVF